MFILKELHIGDPFCWRLVFLKMFSVALESYPQMKRMVVPMRLWIRVLFRNEMWQPKWALKTLRLHLLRGMVRFPLHPLPHTHLWMERRVTIVLSKKWEMLRWTREPRWYRDPKGIKTDWLRKTSHTLGTWMKILWKLELLLWILQRQLFKFPSMCSF